MRTSSGTSKSNLYSRNRPTSCYLHASCDSPQASRSWRNCGRNHRGANSNFTPLKRTKHSNHATGLNPSSHITHSRSELSTCSCPGKPSHCSLSDRKNLSHGPTAVSILAFGGSCSSLSKVPAHQGQWFWGLTVGERGHHGRRDPVQRPVDGANIATELEATLHQPVSSRGGPVFSFIAPLMWGAPAA